MSVPSRATGRKRGSRGDEASSRPRWSLRLRPGAAALVLASLTPIAAACGPSGSSDGEATYASRETATSTADTTDSGAIPARGRAWIVFGEDTVRAEVADSPEEREEGLMHRTDLPDGTGMLFVFESEESRSFWMRDTYVPLDVAFFDSGLRIVDIQQMEPETEEYHTSAEPAMFALEVPQGWFEARGVRVGDRAEVVFGPR